LGTFNFSAKYLSKKDSSTMLPEQTEFVPATRMGIVRKVLLGLEKRARCIFSLLLNAFEWAYASKFETGWAHDNLKEGFTSFF
jgi:hypothetical protein